MMAKRTSRRPCELHLEGRTAQRRFRSVAGLLLLGGIIGASALTDVHAQPDPFGEKKPGDEAKKEEKKEESLKGLPIQAPPGQPLPPAPTSNGPGPAPIPLLQFNINPKSTLQELLPTPPKNAASAGPLSGNDLNRVPEVQFEATSNAVNEEALKRIAHQMAKINHLNDKKADGFLEALRKERVDLEGLPFAMGDACRTKGERSKQFALAVKQVHRALQRGGAAAPPAVPATSSVAPVINAPLSNAAAPPPPSAAPPGMPEGTSAPAANAAAPAPSSLADPVAADELPEPESFWESYQKLCLEDDSKRGRERSEQREIVTLARIAALTQILMPMAEMHPGLAKYLSTVSHIEATRALARLALFSSEDDARKAALDALKIRRERDYTDILVSGLRYPWPAVARRAAEAITKLERNDLLPRLLDVLEQPDPRAPEMQDVKGKRVPVVRELVRVNHHRSCLLCHAPGNTGKVSGDAVIAEVPVPGQSLNPPSGPYNASRQEILVRVDVTYLRQDFSALQAVADANPWPEMQRFDFLVRKRVLSDGEAAAYRAKLKPQEPGQFSPYQRAALAALRELTGRDTEPTPEAWRRLLHLSE